MDRYKLFSTMAISLQKLKKRIIPENNAKSPKKSTRFDGLSESEVAKNTLQDIIKPDLDVVFVGINPSLMAAHTGRYYAGPGNHFYKLLYESKLVPEPITYKQDVELLQYNIGLTNIVARATRSSADLSKSEIKKGAMIVHDKLKKYKPKVAVFNGKCIYVEFADNFNNSSFRFGLQPSKVGDTSLWVVPSSSARCANFPRMQDKLHFYTSLKTYLSFLKGEIKDVNLGEFSFEGRCKQAVPSTSKMWRRKGISAFTHGGRKANKETIAMDTTNDSILALSIPQSTEFILKKPEYDKDLEKSESGVSSSQSDNSQEKDGEKVSSLCTLSVATNNSSQRLNLSPKKTVRKRKLPDKKEQKSVSAAKEYKKTFDFVSMIKQKLNDKDQENVNQNPKAAKFQEKMQKNESTSKPNVNKALKFDNLKLRKSMRSFKVKLLEDVVDDI